MGIRSLGSNSAGLCCRFFVGTVAAVVLVFASRAGAQNANVLFASGIGGNSTEEGRAIAVDDSGNVYATGHFMGTIDLDPGAGVQNAVSAGDRDAYVVKLDPSGNLIWGRSFGAAGEEQGTGIGVDASGNVVVTGFFQNTVDFDPGAGTSNLVSAGASDAFFLKLDSNGDFVWARSIGGITTDYSWGMALDAAGALYAVGHFSDTVDFDPGPGVVSVTTSAGTELFVLKLDAAGDYVWSSTTDGTGSAYALAVALDGAGSVLLTGYYIGTEDFDPGAGTANHTAVDGIDLFVLKLDSAGAYDWSVAVGGTSDQVGNAIAVDTTGYVSVAGHYLDTVDFDPGPGTFNLTSAGDTDAFVLNLDTSGTFRWAASLGDTVDDRGYGIAVDGLGNVSAIGYFQGTVDVDPDPGNVINLTSAGISDVFIQQLDGDGNYRWAGALGGTGIGLGRAIVPGPGNSLYVTGGYHNTTDFDPSPAGVFNLTAVSGRDVFVSAFEPVIGVAPEATSIVPATVGPTAATSVDFTVTFSEPVVNFDSVADLVVTHTGTASTGATLSGGPQVYTVTVTGISGDGSFTVAVSTASDVEDADGNGLASSVTSAAVQIQGSAAGLPVAHGRILLALVLLLSLLGALALIQRKREAGDEGG